MSELIGDWNKLSKVLNSGRFKAQLAAATERVGNYGASEIKKGIVSGKNFAPNHPYTAAKKGSSKPLIDKGDLLGSVTYDVINSNAVFIGVNKNANIAAVHEFGCTIKVTPKMRAYLHYNGLHLKASTQYINIPARPFIRPAIENAEFAKAVYDIYKFAVSEALKS